MGSKLFYELDRGATDDRTDIETGTTSDGTVINYSLVFDKNRRSVWENGTEYGIPNVCNVNYEEDASVISEVTDDTNTSRRAQVFAGKGGVEYTLYVTPSGKLNIYGYAPVSISSFESGYGSDSSFVANNTLTVEIGTDIQSLLTTLKFVLGGTAATRKDLKACSVSITTTDSTVIFSGLTKVYSTAELAALENTTYVSLGTLSTINNLSAPYTITAELNVKDSKDNTISSKITMLEIYDMCYYFFDTATLYESGTSITYSDISSKEGFTEWKSGTKDAHDLPTITDTTKYFYVLIPNRLSLVVYVQGGITGMEAVKTITVTNEHGYSSTYKMYKTGEQRWSGQPNVKLTIS